MKEFMMKV